MDRSEVGTGKLFFQMGIALLTGKRLREVNVHETAQKPWVAGIGQFGQVVAAENGREMRLDGGLLLVKATDRNKVAAGEIFEFGNVKPSALRKFFDNGEATVFERIELGSGGTSVLCPTGQQNCAGFGQGALAIAAVAVAKQSAFFGTFAGCSVSKKTDQSGASRLVGQNITKKIIDSFVAVIGAKNGVTLLSNQKFRVNVIVKFAGLKVDDAVLAIQKVVVTVQVVGGDANGNDPAKGFNGGFARLSHFQALPDYCDW